ncbi:MAG: DUF1538 domain-containing protein [Candidatus Hatepunaea meridiana]|nr:DUF1538 domain-containing protein [Candidatus Hatepunaea meridiana]
MAAQQQAVGKIKVTFTQAIRMLLPYVRDRIMEQIKSVSLIIVYLILFQTIVLQMGIVEASVISVGLSLVIVGLTFFMEGLMLGLMPLGEVIGIKLPQKSKLPVILAFAFILGMGATFAEPAIGVLKAAGSSVKPWEAPLLFLLLNKYANYLVYAVGAGVGIAVMFGMLRFLYKWSLKPFIYILISGLVGITILGYFDPNLCALTGLAWDCGAVTTGPVTVPLVLALGIGICRIAGSSGDGAAGFGMVTLASLFPIITVFTLGAVFLGDVSKPMEETAFFSKGNQSKAITLFLSKEDMTGYAFRNASIESQLALFGGDKNEMLAYLNKLKQNDSKRGEVFGQEPDALECWAALYGSEDQQMTVFNNDKDAVKDAAIHYARLVPPIKVFDILNRNGRAAAQAIIPLTLFLILVFIIILREKLPHADEIMLGITFAVFGMFLFNIGIELGLSKLGDQIGSKLPSSFMSIEMKEQIRNITNFKKETVQTATTSEGELKEFFYLKTGSDYEEVPYYERGHDEEKAIYSYTPTKGPLYGSERGLIGLIVVLIFAFIMGYGATMAEPALNALGLTVEQITVGVFKKKVLMQAVALGVGTGIVLGVAKILWGIPLVFLLVPPYILLLFLSKISTEEYVNIGWDSAGVTTGPVTVPLVLAVGLGLGGQVGVVEGFGILSMASVCPILSVLSVGILVTRRQKAMLQESSKIVIKGGNS